MAPPQKTVGAETLKINPTPLPILVIIILKNYSDPSITAKEKLRKPMCPQTEDADTDADDDDDDIAIT